MDPAQFRQFQLKYQHEAKLLDELNSKIMQLRSPSSKLMAQVQENEIVLEELKLLSEDNTVYKMSGPVMMKIDLEEAKMNVDSRLKYFHSELERIEKEASKLTEQREKQQQVLLDMANLIRKISRDAAERASKQQQGQVPEVE